MKFGPVPVEEAVGKILGHNLAGADGRRLFRKGRLIRAEDVVRLREIGRKVVYVADLEAGDIDEDHAALRLAEAVLNDGLRLSRAATGRVNLISTLLGVLRVDVSRLTEINSYAGITLATLPTNQVVRPGQTVATVKIIPFALPEASLIQAEQVTVKGGAVLSIDPLLPRRVGLILVGSPSVRMRLQQDFEQPLATRVEAFGSSIEWVEFINLEEEADEIELARLLENALGRGCELLILAGETAIQDCNDLVPRAVERAGGCVECVGVPVDPGNLLMLAYLGAVPILGAPGCARSLKTNAIDWILPRLLAGEHVTRSEIALLGHGGLLEDTSKRPMPRSRYR